MIPGALKPRFKPGSRVKVVQHVRIGHRRWTTELTGTVESEGFRPIGGMEMGGKAAVSMQATLKLKREDGELSVVALDEHTQVEEIPAAS